MSKSSIKPKSDKKTYILPQEILSEIDRQAKRLHCSNTEIVKRCLAIGLTTMRIAEDENTDFIYRERIYLGEDNGHSKYEVRDSIVTSLDSLFFSNGKKANSLD